MKKIKITEWFDVYNIEHIRAYNHLQNTGVWPKQFIPDEIIFPYSWHMQLSSMLAEVYVRDKIKEEE